ncbi:MAG: Uma2 family endonuclease [Chloroherpetonaceae bacterium]|nr:Uma2 family endonuclease [Chloroherpetonaceae bacterium]MCS7212333.1 Uma2 family endonuclease [Chloroherpetonaceae bacterium]MDW8019404.1 Uma2 family endonuclease [Chloroherpetonaceae bacterium]MDW8466725.1 Uma2 family endonuclease [Chloroherpetonaceae bacterium]
MGTGEKHELRFTELLSFLHILFNGRNDIIVGGDRFIYYEKGNLKKAALPDAFVIKGFVGDEPDAFKIWETPIDLRFVCEIWSNQNDEAERHRKFAIYQNILQETEYAELTRDEVLYAYRLNSDGEYEQILPNSPGRLWLRELDAELAFEDGLIRVYRNGEKIPTLKEALKDRKM